jgi:segregation and condensation protein B
MDETEIKHVVEAALLAAGRPLTLDRLGELFAAKGSAPDRATLRRVLEALAADYQGRGIELKEVASGWRVQIKRTMTDWLQPLWEERAPRYTRALLETLALVAYRQPITRAEIEEVRGVVVSTNIIRTLLERNWIRVVGHRDVPGKPAMFGTTKDFLDYFGLKKLEDLPTLAEIKDGLPELSPQTDLIEALEADAQAVDAALSGEGGVQVQAAAAEAQPGEASQATGEEDRGATVTVLDTAADADDEEADDSELAGPDLVVPDEEDSVVTENAESGDDSDDSEEGDDAAVKSADVIPLRAAEDDQ